MGYFTKFSCTFSIFYYIFHLQERQRTVAHSTILLYWNVPCLTNFNIMELAKGTMSDMLFNGAK